MTMFLLPAAIRILLGVFGGYLTSVGIDESAQQSIASVLSGGGGAGTVVIGLVTIVVPLIWAHFATTASSLIDKAVKVSGDSASPLAPAAPAAKGKAGVAEYEAALKSWMAGFKV